MSKHRNKHRNKSTAVHQPMGSIPALAAVNWRLDFERARQLVADGAFSEAIAIYNGLWREVADESLRAIIASDLATIQMLLGNFELARQGFSQALSIDRQCDPALTNLALLDFESRSLSNISNGTADRVRIPNDRTNAKDLPLSSNGDTSVVPPPALPGAGIKVAILSFLFNWPSRGGGIIHTVELARFLDKTGYEVRHFYARYPDWGIGNVAGTPPFASEPIEFDSSTWQPQVIQDRFRQAVVAFDPDHVIITDSWNFKPLLAESVRDYPYSLRLQAMECVCPLNNVRLLLGPDGRFQQCQRQQLAEPGECVRCVSANGRYSGRLHQAERELSGFGTSEYHERLLKAFREAECVLVVNPLTEAILSPFAKSVRVVTAGMDPARFPEPLDDARENPLTPQSSRRAGMKTHGEGASSATREQHPYSEPLVDARENPPRVQILFAGLIDEYLKGYPVLHQACEMLWSKRQDFELVATADPPGQPNPFTRHVGWLSQEDLPRQLQAADIVVMPTIAQEALGRPAVEAMAAGRPVIASSLGGLPFTIRDGVTGLLCPPGDPYELANRIEFLLDNPAARTQIGRQGREQFLKNYAWEGIIARHYVPLLTRRSRPLVYKAFPPAAVRRSPGIPSDAALADSNGVRIRLSLIVAVLDSHDVVRRQLLHLNDALTPECELILVDDGSSPPLRATCDSVEKSYPFRLLETHETRSWTQPRARNLGAALAQAQKLLFFDIDHVLTVDVVTKALAFPGDKLHWVRRPGILDEAGKIVADTIVLNGHGLTNTSPSVHLNSFVIRSELFKTLGGYDERFCGRYGGDDVDFNARYGRLCELGIARPEVTDGEGFYYPDPAFNGGRMFHSLQRNGFASDPAT